MWKHSSKYNIIQEAYTVDWLLELCIWSLRNRAIGRSSVGTDPVCPNGLHPMIWDHDQSRNRRDIHTGDHVISLWCWSLSFDECAYTTLHLPVIWRVFNVTFLK